MFLDRSGKTRRAATACQEGKNWKNFCILRTFFYPKGRTFWPQEPLNIVCDSEYTVYTILHLDQALIQISIDPNLLNLFLTLQSLLDKREHPFFITHIRSHSGLPVSLVDGNSKADALVSLLPSSKQQLLISFFIKIARHSENNLTFLAPKLSKLLENVLTAKPLARLPMYRS